MFIIVYALHFYITVWVNKTDVAMTIICMFYITEDNLYANRSPLT